MSHLLYYAYMVLLVLHAPVFWKCILLPGVIFLLEKSSTMFAIYRGRGKTTILEGVPLASRVTKLVVQRPPKFKFTAGDYVFVRIPEISAYEWHAFTISSAPEQVTRMHWPYRNSPL